MDIFNVIKNLKFIYFYFLKAALRLKKNNQGIITFFYNSKLNFVLFYFPSKVLYCSTLFKIFKKS
jgi:hypothetical protein